MPAIILSDSRLYRRLILIICLLTGYWLYWSASPLALQALLIIILVLLLANSKRPHPALRQIVYEQGWRLQFLSKEQNYEDWELVFNLPWAYLVRFKSESQKPFLLVLFKDQINSEQWRDWIFFTHQLRYKK